MPKAPWLGSLCDGAGTEAGAAGAGAGWPLGTTAAAAAAFWEALPKLAGATGVSGVAGVGTSGPADASVAGAAPALRFAPDFFCGAVFVSIQVSLRDRGTSPPVTFSGFHTLLFAFLSFFFGLALADCCGGGGAAGLV